MAGKAAAEKFEYSVTETITVTVSKTRDFIELGSENTMYFWGWQILVEGRVRFHGANLITLHDLPDVAAHEVLNHHCPRDGMAPAWAKGLNASQKHFFKVSGPRMAPIMEQIYSIADYPGAQMIVDGVLTPFGVVLEQRIKNDLSSDQGFSSGTVGYVADEGVMGEVSDDVRRAAELRDNRSEGSGNVAAATPALLTSPFSNM